VGKAAGVWTRLDLLRTAYERTAQVLGGLTDADAARPSGCAGWAVLDLAQHLVFDARRGLVATATPADGPATTDAVGYWRAWQQPSDQADDDRWRTRASASLAGGIDRSPRPTRRAPQPWSWRPRGWSPTRWCAPRGTS
jgi:hypothetical protein